MRPFASLWLISLVIWSMQVKISAATQALAPKKKTTANHSLQINGGLASVGFKDILQSPRVYTGMGWSFGLGYDRIKANRIGSLETNFYQGRARNSLSSLLGANSADVFGLQMNSVSLWRVKAPIGRLQWYAGYSTHGYTQIRSNPELGNSSLGYDAMLGLGGASRLEFPFRLKSDKTYDFWLFKYTRKSYRPIRVGWQVELPLAAVHVRTPFVGVTNTVGNEPLDGLLQDLRENTRFGLPGSYLYVRNQLYGHYYLKNGNAFSLQYQWTAYAYNYNNQPTRSANGMWLLGLRIKLDAHLEQRR